MSHWCTRLFVCIVFGLTLAFAWDAWDLADNFSVTSNPNGQWTYGYMSSGSFVTFPSSSSSSTAPTWYVSGGAEIWKSGYTSYICGIYPSQVSVHCDDGTPSVKWTAPSDHQYYISLIVGGNTDASSTGCYGNGQAANAVLLVNGNKVSLQQINAYEYKYTGSHYLSSNQTVLLYITKNTGAGNTQTKITIFKTAYSPSDLATDYVIASPTNPNGRWTYQYISNGQYYTDNTYEIVTSPLTSAVSCYRWSYTGTTAYISKYSATSFYVGIYPNMISLVSYSAYLPAVTWTASYSYRYYVLVNVGGSSANDGFTSNNNLLIVFTCSLNCLI